MSGFLTKLFGEFAPGNKGTANQAPAPVPVTITNPGGSIVDSNNTVPNNNTPQSDGKHPAIPAAGKDDKSPLANFKDLWQPVDSKTTPALPTSLLPTFEIDRAKIREAASKVDFTVGMDAALLDKASKGDAAALASIINSATQNAYALGAEATLSVTKNALTEHNTRFQQLMPEILRRHTAGNMLGDNPAFSSPALAPVVKAVETALAARMPNASSAEIADQTRQAMEAMAMEVVQGKGWKVDQTKAGDPGGQGNSTIGRAETNWDDWFNADTTRAA